MRSLKIIVFRDTDKPYTMILSSGLLIGIVFAMISVLTLLTFSMMSNVMLLARPVTTQDMTEVAALTGEKPQAEEEATEELPAGEAVESEQAQPDSTEGEVADTEAAGTDEGEDVSTGEAVTEPESSLAGPLAFMQLYQPTNGPLEIEVLSGPNAVGNSVRISVRVLKRLQGGEQFRGKLVAVLVNKDDGISQTYPTSIQFGEAIVTNPERGVSFSIRYSKDDDVAFNNVNPINQKAVVLLLYNEDGSELLWREVVPTNF